MVRCQMATSNTTPRPTRSTFALAVLQIVSGLLYQPIFGKSALCSKARSLNRAF